MATKFLEPGGDATFNVTSFFSQGGAGTAASLATDFVHGGHIKSLKYAVNSASALQTGTTILADAGSRISMYIYLNALPTATATIFKDRQSGATNTWNMRLTSGGVLQLWDGTVAQRGSNGATLSTGQWYRISVAFTITSTSVNRFEVFVNSTSSISATNVTLANITGSNLYVGNIDADATLDMRSSDHYVDDSNSLTDTGDIWVTAKRPNANGTTNEFTTQIGSGGSSYGSGHSPQVNERALSNTNGWSIANGGVAKTEEYNIEGKATGDIDISLAHIVDYMGWADVQAVLASSNSLIINGATFAKTTTSGESMFTSFAGSTTYPAGTGADIGWTTSTTSATYKLFECGIVVAYTPGATTTKTETGVARIQKAVSQTETGVGRVQKSVSQTISGVANITGGAAPASPLTLAGRKV